MKEKSGYFFGGKLLLLMNARKGIVGSFLCWSRGGKAACCHAQLCFLPLLLLSLSPFFFVYFRVTQKWKGNGRGGAEMKGGMRSSERYTPPSLLPSCFSGENLWEVGGGGGSHCRQIYGLAAGAGATNPLLVRHFLRRKTNGDICVVGGKSCAPSRRFGKLEKTD